MEMDDTSGLEAETEGHASHEMLPLCKDVAISVERMLGNLTPLSTQCCIYRVPRKLYLVKKEAYEPSLLSIGPLHHGKEHLVAMEEHKLRYLRNFLLRLGITLEECVQIISEEETRIRDSYSESINLSSEDFLKMVLVDGCFIIELILCNCFEYLREPSDWIYNKPWLLCDVRLDMILLENQLPFFFLERLFNLDFPLEQNKPPFLAACILFFHDYLHLQRIESVENLVDILYMISGTEVKHFVDLLWVCQQPSSSRESGGEIFELSKWIPSATDLHEAGVRFELLPSHKTLLDIQFESDKGVLKIPKLVVDDSFEYVFRNLIAFEQCYYRNGSYVVDYMHLMDHLIDTEKDVDILVKRGIIVNWLGDKVAVTNLFNRFLDETLLNSENYYFGKVLESVNAYCEEPWHSSWAALRHDYFSSPWRGASTIAAAILLVLTFMQTVFSGMSAK